MLIYLGDKSIEAKDTGHSKSRYTIVATISGEGRMLPAQIIFKGLKKVPVVVLPDNVVVAVAKGNSDAVTRKQIQSE